MLHDLVQIVPLDDQLGVTKLWISRLWNLLEHLEPAKPTGPKITLFASWAIMLLQGLCSSLQCDVQCHGIKGHQFYPEGLLIIRAFS